MGGNEKKGHASIPICTGCQVLALPQTAALLVGLLYAAAGYVEILPFLLYSYKLPAKIYGHAGGSTAHERIKNKFARPCRDQQATPSIQSVSLRVPVFPLLWPVS